MDFYFFANSYCTNNSTDGFIADKLTSWGYIVVDKVGKHGVVTSLTVGD